ncbi:uncharacterized protein N7473_013187 [Penicillium subrubescens]|uniref:uncharacterized protein n=1 Tax=Penicillium subrubescens TaxID=1316194 RepID=UPI00254588FF|nr:uncharacterized protein N7473_013187 [Penicillium subrubescens]KAJ5873628.1 hypothetical protein N7473_013187 [Penicillium subrubescens]
MPARHLLQLFTLQEFVLHHRYQELPIRAGLELEPATHATALDKPLKPVLLALGPVSNQPIAVQ